MLLCSDMLVRVGGGGGASSSASGLPPKPLAPPSVSPSTLPCSLAVAKAKSDILALMADEETSITTECPAAVVGRIIGRGGETIRALQSASQAHITGEWWEGLGGSRAGWAGLPWCVLGRESSLPGICVGLLGGGPGSAPPPPGMAETCCGLWSMGCAPSPQAGAGCIVVTAWIVTFFLSSCSGPELPGGDPSQGHHPGQRRVLPPRRGARC